MRTLLLALLVVGCAEKKFARAEVGKKVTLNPTSRVIVQTPPKQEEIQNSETKSEEVAVSSITGRWLLILEEGGNRLERRAEFKSDASCSLKEVVKFSDLQSEKIISCSYEIKPTGIDVKTVSWDGMASKTDSISYTFEENILKFGGQIYLVRVLPEKLVSEDRVSDKSRDSLNDPLNDTGDEEVGDESLRTALDSLFTFFRSRLKSGVKS